MTNPRQTMSALKTSAMDSTASATSACELPRMPATSLLPASTTLTANPIKVARRLRLRRLFDTGGLKHEAAQFAKPSRERWRPAGEFLDVLRRNPPAGRQRSRQSNHVAEHRIAQLRL